MTFHLAAALIGGFALAASASAATIVQTRTFTNADINDQNITSLEFQQFDPGLGTLLSVTVSFSLSKEQGYHSVYNDSEASGTINITHRVAASINNSLGGGSMLRDDFSSLQTPLVAESSSGPTFIDGRVGDAPVGSYTNTGGPDHVRFDATPVTVSASGTIMGGPGGQDLYVGTNPFTLNVETIQSQAFTGMNVGLYGGYGPSDILGTVTITYNYEAIPEPSAALLGCLAALGLLRRRRA